MDSRAVETSLVDFLRKELRVREDPLERDFELVVTADGPREIHVSDIEF